MKRLLKSLWAFAQSGLRYYKPILEIILPLSTLCYNVLNIVDKLNG